MTLLHISTWLRFAWRMICCPPIPPSSDRPSHHLVIIVVIVLCLDDLHLPQDASFLFLILLHQQHHGDLFLLVARDILCFIRNAPLVDGTSTPLAMLLAFHLFLCL